MSYTNFRRAAPMPPFALPCVFVPADSWSNLDELDQNHQNQTNLYALVLGNTILLSWCKSVVASPESMDSHRVYSEGAGVVQVLGPSEWLWGQAVGSAAGAVGPGEGL